MAIKKTMRKQATTLHRRSSGGSGWLTGLLVGLVIGGFVVFYLLAIKPTTPLATSPTATDTENKKDATPDKKKASGPRFDFYKLLPENSNTTNVNKPSAIPTQAPTPSAFDSDADTTTNSAATTSATGTPIETHAATPDSKLPGTYLLQAGSFRSNPDADKVRASIILLGLPSRVEMVKNDKSETLYRVYVGSFSTAADMQKAQATLTANKINAVTVKPK